MSVLQHAIFNAPTFYSCLIMVYQTVKNEISSHRRMDFIKESISYVEKTFVSILSDMDRLSSLHKWRRRAHVLYKEWTRPHYTTSNIYCIAFTQALRQVQSIILEKQCVKKQTESNCVNSWTAVNYIINKWKELIVYARSNNDEDQFDSVIVWTHFITVVLFQIDNSNVFDTLWSTILDMFRNSLIISPRHPFPSIKPSHELSHDDEEQMKLYRQKVFISKIINDLLGADGNDVKTVAGYPSEKKLYILRIWIVVLILTRPTTFHFQNVFLSGDVDFVETCHISRIHRACSKNVP